MPCSFLNREELSFFLLNKIHPLVGNNTTASSQADFEFRVVGGVGIGLTGDQILLLMDSAESWVSKDVLQFAFNYSPKVDERQCLD